MSKRQKYEKLRKVILPVCGRGLAGRVNTEGGTGVDPKWAVPRLGGGRVDPRDKSGLKASELGICKEARV